MAGLFPVLLNVRDRLCVVVGGGDVALRKVSTLAERGARVRVISPAAGETIMALADKGEVEWVQRPYYPGDLAGAFLCVAAADDPEVNARVAAEARAGGVLANLGDDPESSDYQVPSFFEDGPLLVAVSTQGASPAVARTLRRMIQAWLGNSFGAALEIVRSFRARARERISDSKARVRFWETAVSPELLDRARQGDLEAVKQMLAEALERFKA